MRWLARSILWLLDLPGRAFDALDDWFYPPRKPEPIDWGTDPFEILRVAGVPPGTQEGFAGMTLIPPLAPVMHLRADLIIVPRSVYANHREWVRETLALCLKPAGRLVVVR
jgi:hypothetical protein